MREAGSSMGFVFNLDLNNIVSSTSNEQRRNRLSIAALVVRDSPPGSAVACRLTSALGGTSRWI
jgi:hypothetical protein